MELRPLLDRCITGFFTEKHDKRTLLEWIETLGGPAFCRAFRFDTSRGGQVVVGSTLLHQAVGMTSILCVRVLLDVGVSANALDADGRTPLNYLLAFFGLKKPRLRRDSAEYTAELDTILDMLLEAGANIDAKSPACEPLLIHAAEWAILPPWSSFFTSMVSKLIELGADITTKTRYGSNMIHVMAACGSVPLLEQLIDTGRLDINHRDEDGRTPLFRAKPACLALLLHRGADMSIKSKCNRFPLDFGRETGHYQQKVDVWETEVACR